VGRRPVCPVRPIRNRIRAARSGRESFPILELLSFADAMRNGSAPSIQPTLPALSKYPSRPKVCRLTDRYIFCGRLRRLSEFI
jgi:hypothetical protein